MLCSKKKPSVLGKVLVISQGPGTRDQIPAGTTFPSKLGVWFLSCLRRVMSPTGHFTPNGACSVRGPTRPTGIVCAWA